MFGGGDMRVYIPFRLEKSYTIDASGSITDTISPDFEIATVNVTADADVSVTLTFAGKSYSGSFNVVNDFGRPCKDEINVSASNSGTAAENLTIEILGTKQLSR